MFDPWVREVPWRWKWQSLQFSCLENPMDRGAWLAVVQRVAKSQTQLGTHTHTHTHTHTSPFISHVISDSQLLQL